MKRARVMPFFTEPRARLDNCSGEPFALYRCEATFGVRWLVIAFDFKNMAVRKDFSAGSRSGTDASIDVANQPERASVWFQLENFGLALADECDSNTSVDTREPTKWD